MIVAETPHLRLRRWRRDDIDTLFRWATDPRMMEHMGRGPFSRAEAERMLDRTLHHYRGYGFGVWLAEDRETGEPVGRVGLSYHRAWPDDPEVGWWIDPSRWGEGLATEAGEAAIEYAFEGLGFRRVRLALHRGQPRLASGDGEARAPEAHRGAISGARPRPVGARASARGDLRVELQQAAPATVAADRRANLAAARDPVEAAVHEHAAQSRSLPSTPRSNQRPPACGSITASAQSTAPMWCGSSGHQREKPAVKTSKACLADDACDASAPLLLGLDRERGQGLVPEPVEIARIAATPSGSRW